MHKAAWRPGWGSARLLPYLQIRRSAGRYVGKGGLPQCNLSFDGVGLAGGAGIEGRVAARQAGMGECMRYCGVGGTAGQAHSMAAAAATTAATMPVGKAMQQQMQLHMCIARRRAAWLLAWVSCVRTNQKSLPKQGARVACGHIQADGHAQIIVLEHDEGRKALLASLAGSKQAWHVSADATRRGNISMVPTELCSLHQRRQRSCQGTTCCALGANHLLSWAAYISTDCSAAEHLQLTASNASAQSAGQGEFIAAWSHVAQAGWDTLTAKISTSVF